MKSLSVFAGSLDQSLRIVGALLVVGGLGLSTLYLLPPEVTPLPPGELDRPKLSGFIDNSPDAEQSDEFVSRPLFVEGRRPLLTIKAPPTKQVNDEPAPPKVLENVKLLGVFSSGDTKGVILQENGGDRRRLLVGDKTGAWTLSVVEAREAVFKHGKAESRITMGLIATGLPKVRASSKAVVTRADGAEGVSEEQPEKPRNWAPSFDNLFERRRQRKTVAEDAGSAGGAPGTQKRD